MTPLEAFAYVVFMALIVPYVSIKIAAWAWNKGLNDANPD